MNGIDVLTSDYAKPWLLFWAVVLLAHGYMDFTLFRKVRGWGRGMKQARPFKGNIRRAAKIWLAEIFLQRQLFSLSFVRWLAHMLIFWGFAGLAALSVFTVILRPLGRLGIDGGVMHYFLYGNGYPVIKIWGDGFGLALLAGLIASFVRRFVLRPSQQINEQMDFTLLVFLLWLTISGFALEWLRLPLLPAGAAGYSLIGYLFTPVNAPADQIRRWLTAAWTIHGLSGAALLIYLPNSKLMHSILAPLVIAMNATGEQERKDLYWPDVKKHRATGSPRS